MDQPETSTTEIISRVIGVGEMTPKVESYRDRVSGREGMVLRFRPEIITKTITAAYGTRVRISEKSPTSQGSVLGTIEGPVKVYVYDYDTSADDERLNRKAAAYNADTGAVTGIYSEGDKEPKFSLSVIAGESLPQFRERVRREHRKGGVDVIELPEVKFDINASIRVEKKEFDLEKQEDLGKQALNNTLRRLGTVVKEGIVYYSR